MKVLQSLVHFSQVALLALVLIDLEHLLEMYLLECLIMPSQRGSTISYHTEVLLHSIKVGEGICEEVKVC